MAAYRQKADRSYPTFYGLLLALFLDGDDFCNKTLAARLRKARRMSRSSSRRRSRS
jgi:hypothetical protein